MARPQYAEPFQTDEPTILIRRAEERGHAELGWLTSFHTFSFSNYFDPNYMGFRSLRVINEDRIQPTQGFPPHHHQDMEILTYVLSGTLTHQDSLGNGSTIHPGEVQRMSAGTGVYHSEYNTSSHEKLHLLQIWVIPEETGIQPEYEQRHFSDEERKGIFRLIASQDGRQGSLKVHQDMNLYSTILPPGEALIDRLPRGRYGWIQVVRGALMLNGDLMGAGDGAALIHGGSIELETPLEGSTAEVLLFDLK